MKRPRTDYTVRPNQQTHRLQEDLWDVVLAKTIQVTTAVGQEAAQELADRLNEDHWYLKRGQTRQDMHGTRKSVERKE